MRNTFRSLLLIILTLTVSSGYSQEKKWTLEECITYALEHNISVRQSELDLKLDQIDKKDALGNFLPSANISASHNWSIGLTPGINGVYQKQTIQLSNGSFTSQIDIYRGLQNQARFRRAKMQIIAGEYSITKMKEDIALNVANAFLQILFNKENLKVQQEQLESDKKQRQRSNELLEGGVIPRGDLLDIDATVAADQQHVIESENQLLISKLSLAQLLQLDDFKNFDIADEKYEMEENEILLQTPDAIYQKAKESQTVIKLAQTNVDVAEQDVKIAKSAYQPTLSGFYSFGSRISYNDTQTYKLDDQGNPVIENGGPVFVNEHPDPFFKQFNDNKEHSFGLQLTIPVLNGFAVRNNVARAKVALDRSRLAFEQTDLDLERNVYTAYTDAQGALKAYEAAVSAADAREEALNYAKERYDVGMINVFELNQAQTLSVNAQSDVLRAKYDYLFRVKILEYYFGMPIFQN